MKSFKKYYLWMNKVMIAVGMALVGCGNTQESTDANTSRAKDMGGMMDGGGMGGQGRDMTDGEMGRAMMSEGLGQGMMEDMKGIRTMLMQHEKISRRVENLPNGVKTWTTSKDPQLACVKLKVSTAAARYAVAGRKKRHGFRLAKLAWCRSPVFKSQHHLCKISLRSKT